MKNIKQFNDFAGEDGYLIVDGLSNEVEGGKKKLSDVKNEIINEIPEPPEQVQANWEQDDDTQKDYIKNKPDIPSNRYERKTIEVVAEEDGYRKYNFNVNEMESLTVNLKSVVSYSSTVKIHLSENCDNALVLLNAPDGHEAESISCYRGNTELTNIYQITPIFSEVPYLIQSTRKDGSGMGTPTDWDETKLIDAHQFIGYKKLYNSTLRNITKVLVKIIADYAFIYPIEFKTPE